MNVRKKFSLWKCDEASEQNAQGSGGVSTPVGVKKRHRNSVWGHGLVGELAVLDSWLNLRRLT